MSEQNLTERLCIGCKKSLPATSEFFYAIKGDITRNNPSGWASRCIPCYAARQRGWRAQKPGRTTKYWRKTRDKDPAAESRRQTLKTRKLKTRVLLAYSPDGPSCACCAERTFEFLTIDHIHGDGAEHRRQIGATRLYAALVRDNFPPGFRVLCLNCNFSLGRYGYCPHQTPGFDITSIDVNRRYRRVLTPKPGCGTPKTRDEADEK